MDGAWVRPDLLEQVASGGTNELQVLRGTYWLGETPVEAVSFLSRTQGDYASTVFDDASGMLVATTGRYKAAGSPVHGPLDMPEGNVQIMYTRLVDVRERIPARPRGGDARVGRSGYPAHVRRRRDRQQPLRPEWVQRELAGRGAGHAGRGR